MTAERRRHEKEKGDPQAALVNSLWELLRFLQ